MRRLNFNYVYPRKCYGLILDCLYKCWQEMDITDDEYNYLIEYLKGKIQNDKQNYRGY